MNKEKIFDLLKNWSISFFLVGGIIMFFSSEILKQRPPQLLSYLTITSGGIFLFSIFLESFFCQIKKIDFEYFRNVIIGISGGLAVWIFSGISLNFNGFNDDFWLSINGILIKITSAIIILIFGYIICKKKT